MSQYSQNGLHPDPDTLGAFAEGVLPEHERLACMAHLAECAVCREVVYLAEEPVAPVPAVEKAGWWKRWLAPVAAVSGVALAGVVFFSVAHPRREATVRSAPAPEVALSAPPPVVMPPQPLAVPRVLRKAVPPPPPPVPAPSFPIGGAVSADAVGPNAGIAGTVTDSAGAVIPGAAVIVSKDAGVPAVRGATNQAGQFLVSGLRPGQYSVQIERPGFRPETKKVEVQPQQVAKVDAALNVGSTSETVEVAASAATIFTDSATAAPPPPPPAPVPLAARNAVSIPAEVSAVTVVSSGKVTLSLNATGALARSDNGGKKWKQIKAVWQGKAVKLEAISADATGAVFRLTTDSGAVWLSRDGSHWRR